jgi:hypothetical protein
MFAGWGAAALLAIVALGGTLGVFGHGKGEAPAHVVRAPVVRTPSSSVEGLSQPPPTRVKPPRGQATLTAATPTPAAASFSLDRCDQLRKNPNWSANDREWFLSQCLGNRADTTAPAPPVGASGEPPVSGPDVPASPSEEPQATTRPMTTSDGDAAIALAVQWLESGAPVTYRVDAASCTSGPAGSDWLVTCQATLAGCAESGACARSVSMCVHGSPPSVGPLREC